MNIFLLEFITGMSLGIEFFFGEDLEPQDKFAMCVDILILRITYIYR